MYIVNHKTHEIILQYHSQWPLNGIFNNCGLLDHEYEPKEL